MRCDVQTDWILKLVRSGALAPSAKAAIVIGNDVKGKPVPVPLRTARGLAFLVRDMVGEGEHVNHKSLMEALDRLGATEREDKEMFDCIHRIYGERVTLKKAARKKYMNTEDLRPSYPPKMASYILYLLLENEHREQALGDLDEDFAVVCERFGVR